MSTEKYVRSDPICLIGKSHKHHNPVKTVMIPKR